MKTRSLDTGIATPSFATSSFGRSPAHARSGVALLCTLAALSAMVDFVAAVAYWSAHGVGPAQILRVLASWVIGPRPPATPAVLAVGAGVSFLIYLAMATAFDRLLAARRASSNAGFATGSVYGLAAYVIVYEVLVPLLVPAAGGHRAPAWVATCVAVHMLAIGPLMAWGLGRKVD